MPAPGAHTTPDPHDLGERIIRANGVDLCAEAFGDPADPALLLLAGVGSSLDWWEEDFCARLAGAGRYVIRYDHRDTGRSVLSWPKSQSAPPWRSLHTDGSSSLHVP